MQTSNFEFLKQTLPELATLGEFAEQYLYPDPASCGVKLRLFAEQLTRIVHHDLNLPEPDEDTFLNRIREIEFKNAVPKSVISKLHWLRRNGNKAAHGEDLTTDAALLSLKDAHDLGKWLY
ncbi:MAG: DUF4145 domain-containing protein, partial [bacterium]